MNNVRTSGPLPVPPQVAEASAQGIISHRSDAFRALLPEVLDGLRPFFGTAAPILPFTCSGTGGMEAAVVNCLAPGDRVLAVSAGHFGNRFAEVARCYGADVTVHHVPWGTAPTAADVAEALRAAGPVRAVLLTHNETSTGVLAPLRELCAAITESSDALILVDGVSSVGATRFDMDDWGVDVAVTVTQKALMAQPGLSLIATSPRALRVAHGGGQRRYYFDFPRMAAAVEEGTTTYTPAVAVLQGLRAAVGMLRAEGPERVFERHRAAAGTLRQALLELGMIPAADAWCASPTVTAVHLPDGVGASGVRRALERDHGILVASGRSAWKENTVRIGHMGAFHAAEIEATVAALGQVLGTTALLAGEVPAPGRHT